MLCMSIFKQFSEWIFLISGIGLFPQPHEIQKVTAYLHLQTCIPIPFQNPTKEDVFIDILLTGKLFSFYLSYVIL